MQFVSAVFPILLFAVSGVTSQPDPCDIIIYELPRKCSCYLRELTCKWLNDDDIYELTRAIQGPRRDLKFSVIELEGFNLNSQTSEAFRNVDTHTLRLVNSVLESNSSFSGEFFNSFSSLEDLGILYVETVESERNWRHFLPEAKQSLKRLLIAGEWFSELWEGFPRTIGPNIEILTLTTNVTELSIKTLHCPRCSTIAVTRSNLNKINPYTFENCENLRHLQLHNNNLREIPNYAFSGRSLMNIQSINLRGNQLSNITPESFYGLSSHTVINLQGQRLDCDCSYTWLNRYKFLQYPDCIQNGGRHWDLGEFLQTNCYGFTTESLRNENDSTTKDRWQTDDHTDRSPNDQWKTSPRPWYTKQDWWQTDYHTDRSSNDHWQTSSRPWRTPDELNTSEDVTTVQPNSNSSNQKQVIVVFNEVNVKVNSC